MLQYSTIVFSKFGPKIHLESSVICFLGKWAQLTVVVVPQSVILVPPSTCQIQENQPIRQTNEISRIQKWIGNTKSLIRRYSLNKTPWSRDEGELPHKKCPLSHNVPRFPVDWRGMEKNARCIPNKARYRRVAMPIIRSSNHPQETQKSNPRQKSIYSNSGAKAHELQWGGHLS